jgi:hypothetical protein
VNVFFDLAEERIEDMAVALVRDVSQAASKDESACCAELEAHGAHLVGEQLVIV